MNYTCRNCGGDLEPMGKGMGKCSYCKAINSMPNIVSEKIARAERLRREMLNFDSAAALYSQIINEAPDEADAYWGLVLCRYGIEYVKDKNGESKATCHRTIENRIQDDSDFKLACEKASPDQREYLICTPFSGQPEKGVIFMRYSQEYKLECIELYRQGI